MFLATFLVFNVIGLSGQEKEKSGESDTNAMMLLQMQEKKDLFNISGFADMQWSYRSYKDENSILSGLFNKNNEFMLNNVNLYFNFNVNKDLLFFTEIRFLFTPSGMTVPSSAPGTFEYVANETRDQSEYTFQYGSIFIERAYMEWKRFSFLRVRAGRYLTPYGIWSQDHGSPILTSVRLPALVSPPTVDLRIQPNMVGLEFLGTWDFSLFMLDYAAYIGNNDTEQNGFGDYGGEMKSFGGFVNLNFPLGDTVNFEFGGSVYSGRHVRSISITSTGEHTYRAFNDNIFALTHVKLSIASLPLKGELIFQGEFMYQWVEVDTNKVTPAALPPGFTLVPKWEHWDTYGQVEYSMYNLITPYYRYNYTNINKNAHPLVKSLHAHTVGINVKPYTALVLKFEYNFYDYTVTDPAVQGDNDNHQILSSISLSF